MIYVSVGRDPQSVIDEHAISAATGRCLTCGTHGCEQRREALAKLAAWQRLPRRTRGASRAELIGARRVDMIAPL